jgi:hypothetical protein
MGRGAQKEGWARSVVVNFTLTLLSAVMECLAGKPFLRAQGRPLILELDELCFHPEIPSL